jgi:hypothetical protein
MAAVNRGFGGWRGAAADAVAVSGRPLRGAAGRRVDVGVRLSELRLCRPRQWGACWLALLLWRELQLDQFWSKRLGSSRKGTHWDQVLFLLVAYRLLAPGSEWRLRREWFRRSALADLLGEDAGLAEIHKLYRCHDRLLAHRQAVFDHLTGGGATCSTSATTRCCTISRALISRRIRRFRTATNTASGTRATTGRIVYRSPSPWL